MTNLGQESACLVQRGGPAVGASSACAASWLIATRLASPPVGVAAVSAEYTVPPEVGTDVPESQRGETAYHYGDESLPERYEHIALLPHLLEGCIDGVDCPRCRIGSGIPEDSARHNMPLWIHAPELLPPLASHISGSFFPSWDADAVAERSRGLGNHKAHSAASLAFSESRSRQLWWRSGHDAVERGPLFAAAVAVERLSASFGASASGVAGLPGQSSDPGALLTAAPTTLPVLLLPVSVPSCAASRCPTRMRLLAHGAMPIIDAPSWPSRSATSGVPHVWVAGASASPDLSSICVLAGAQLADEGVDPNLHPPWTISPSLMSPSTTGAASLAPTLANCGSAADSPSSVQRCVGITLFGAPANSCAASCEAALARSHSCSAVALADACFRLCANAALLMASEWAAVSSTLISTFHKLEACIDAASPSQADRVAARAAAAVCYPSSPVPLATAELWRSTVAGANIGGGLSRWLEVDMGDVGLVRALRAVENGLAALESLATTRAVRAAELLLGSALAPLLALCGVQSCCPPENRCALPKTSPPSFATCAGVDCGLIAGASLRSSSLTTLAEETAQLLVLLQSVRNHATQARAVYSALFAHLRFMLRDGVMGERAASATSQFVTLGEGGLAASDVRLLHNALAPSCVPATAPSSLKHLMGETPLVVDPLGLGFASSIDAREGVSPLLLMGEATCKGSGHGPLHDPFLPFSLGSLLEQPSSSEQTNVKGFLQSACTLPMGEYPASGENLDESGGSSSLRSLSSHVAAMLHRWHAVCANDVEVWDESLLHFGIPCSVASNLEEKGNWCEATARAASVFFDDRSCPVRRTTSTVDEGDFSDEVGGAHVLFVPLPPSATNNALPLALLLRIAVKSTLASVRVCACVVQMPSHSQILASAPYAPPPGLLAAAHATSASGGRGGLAAPAVASDGARALALLLLHPHGKFSAGSKIEATEDLVSAMDAAAAASGDTLSLALVSYRSAPWIAVPADIARTTASGCSPSPLLVDWAVGHAPRIALSTLTTKSREIATWPTPNGSPSDSSAAASAHAASSVVLEASGPRGAAVVLLGSPLRRLLVLDLEDDETEEEELI